MSKKGYKKLALVAKELGMPERRILEFAEQEIVEIVEESGERFLEEIQINRLRLAALLMDEMDVNMEGVEIILDLRERIVALEEYIHNVMKLLGERHPDVLDELLRLLED